MRTLQCTVPAAFDGRPLKHLLRGELGISSTLLKTLKVARGRDPAQRRRRPYVNAVVRTGDTVTVVLSERAPRETDVAPLDIPLPSSTRMRTCWCSTSPPDSPCTRCPPTSPRRTLPERWSPTSARARCRTLVSRLDRGTSGLLIAAKSGYVHELLRRALHSEELRREYRALALGRVTPPRGIIDAPIAPRRGSLVKRCVAPNGLPSRTEYEVLSYHGELTLLRLAPRTGRTHQLRVHMASLGHPLAGDWLYGTEDRALIARPALHSYALWFTHPLTHAVLHFTAPLPEDMERLIK